MSQNVASFSPSGVSDSSKFPICIVIRCLIMALAETAAEPVLISILGELRSISASNAILCQHNSDLLRRVAGLESQLARGHYDRSLLVSDANATDGSSSLDSGGNVSRVGKDLLQSAPHAFAPIPERTLKWICPVCHIALRNLW
jgi:hypothetical protein